MAVQDESSVLPREKSTRGQGGNGKAYELDWLLQPHGMLLCAERVSDYHQ